MTDTLARLRSGKMVFETMVDLDSAIKLRKGQEVNINEIVRDNNVYTDQKKGLKAGSLELQNVFGTTDFNKIVEGIVKKGQVEVTQEFRDEALEARRKQVVDFLVRNAINASTSRPFTPDMLEHSLKESGAKIENKPIESQIPQIIEKLRSIIPIKIETKKLKVKIPAMHTGKAYGIVNEYKEKEDWQTNGDLEITLNIPVGIQMEFYDKLNSVTHGSAITEELSE
ncbi:ribosome assembly factor SBDS [Candidatus Pacearchaeota archaeon]|nr:ribosome assembly factor SBDS [Candidatus Pacearchaeota archaeon]|tara:strand:- start:963 stop:1640 length:678 start_codon:yes stop_codon:yes gene_type:complete